MSKARECQLFGPTPAPDARRAFKDLDAQTGAREDQRCG